MKIKNQKFKKTKIFFFFINLITIITSFSDEVNYSEYIAGKYGTIIILLAVNIYIIYSLFFLSQNSKKNDSKNNMNSKPFNNIDTSEKPVSTSEINNKKALVSDLDKQIINREKFIIDTELKYIDNMNGLEFEKYITDLFIKLDYNAIKTKSSNDDGVDVIAEKDGIKYAIQCKRYSQPVGNKAVQEVYASKGITHSDVAVVLTNNTFTSSAIKEANILGVELWDRNKLTNLLYTAFHFDFRNIDNKTKRITTNKKTLEYDPLLNEAIEMVIESGQASTSFIQRRFKVGLARASRIIDEMEEMGIITDYQGSKPREVLMTKERWEETKLQS